jgi:hypothetical protein
MDKTFNPEVSNLNVHMDHKAYDEFKRDWPSSKPFGLDSDSRHSPPYVAMQDVLLKENGDYDREKAYELISRCDINQYWSAMVCQVGQSLYGYFCEIAGAQAMLHNDPSTGIPATEGWWKLSMEAFANQVEKHCHACGVPLRRYGQLALSGEYEEVSATHQPIYKPKDKNRRVSLVTVDGGQKLGIATDYIGNGRLK